MSEKYTVTSSLNEAEQLLKTFFSTPRVLYPGQIFGVLRSPYQFAAPPCICAHNTGSTGITTTHEKTGEAKESARCGRTFADGLCWCCVSIREIESADFFGIDAPRCLDLHARLFSRSGANNSLKCKPLFNAVSVAEDVPEATATLSSKSLEQPSSTRSSQIGNAPSAQEQVLTPVSTAAETSDAHPASCFGTFCERCRCRVGKKNQDPSAGNTLVPRLGRLQNVTNQCHWVVNPVFGFTATPVFGKESLFFKVEMLETHHNTPAFAAVVCKDSSDLVCDVGLSTTTLPPFAVGSSAIHCVVLRPKLFLTIQAPVLCPRCIPRCFTGFPVCFVSTEMRVFSACGCQIAEVPFSATSATFLPSVSFVGISQVTTWYCNTGAVATGFAAVFTTPKNGYNSFSFTTFGS